MNRQPLFWLLALLGGLIACASVRPVPTPLPGLDAVATVPPATATVRPALSPQPPSNGTSVAEPVPAPSPTPRPIPHWQNGLDTTIRDGAQDAVFHQLLPENSGLWQYDSGSFWHPIALAMNETTAFLLDGGRVLALDLVQGNSPQPLLQPGDFVEGLLVQEPLDMTLIDDELLVLDRAGGMYRLDLATAVWQLERNERPIGATSSHYFVALGHDAAASQMRLRLESSYRYAQYFFPDERERLWSLPEDAEPVDVSGVADQVYVLWRNLDGTATVAAFQETRRLTQFAVTVTITQPRQIVATTTAVYILDLAGRRLITLHPDTGDLQAVYQLPNISAFAATAGGDQLLFVGRDQLFFWQQPENSRYVSGGPTLPAPQPQDTAVWQTAGPYSWPITGNSQNLTARDLQMPGAPRHYRLGIHEGIDFYWANGTPVYAAASGTVIRATVDYERPDEIIFNRRRAENLAFGYTAPDNLDFSRGIQVWIMQDDGFVARYSHLSEIGFGIEEGTAVVAGQQIGRIGNTGSPASINSETEDAHLHFELRLGDAYLGQYLRPGETRDLIKQLFSP